MKMFKRILTIAALAFVASSPAFAAADFDAVEFGTNRPPIQTFYVPIPEDDLLTALRTIAAKDTPSDPVQTYLSIAIFADNTVVYYDQWENGFDRDIANPVNLYSPSNRGGTQIWGDGDPSNGYPPGFKGDVLRSGDVLILNNAIESTSRKSKIKWDAGDKIGVTKPVAVTRVGWASESATLLAGGNEVYDTSYFGTEFVSPVGVNTPRMNEVFEYTGFSIMAANKGTVVEIDTDADGAFDLKKTLDEGESYLVNGGVRQGARIRASKPVQVDLLTGDIQDGYESRFYRLLPTSLWSSSQTTPVSTPAYTADDDGDEDEQTSGTVVFLYNPHDSAMTVRAMTRNGSGSKSKIVSEPVTIKARSMVRVNVKDGYGARYVSDDGRTFYGLAAIDATGTRKSNGGYGDNRTWDWGFALIPDEALTKQVVVGLGLGRDPTSSVRPSENGAPIWVCPVGNGDTRTRVYVDYDGDPLTGRAADPYGNKYDKSYDLRELQSVQIYDPDGDQTGMLVYTLDKGVKLAAAWGEDPATATGGAPGLDMGTGIPPFPDFIMQKTSSLHVDNDGDGYITPNDVLRYDILIENIGRQPVSDLDVSDHLPAVLKYIPGTTRFVDSDGRVSAIADLPGDQPFALSAEGGWLMTYNLLPGKSCHITYDCTVDEKVASTGVTDIRNDAVVSNYGNSFTNSIVNSLRGRVGDYVWRDLDRDGVQDADEPGLNGVVARLLDGAGDLVLDDFGRPYEQLTKTGSTGRDGLYLFTGVPAGDYIVSFQLPDGYHFTIPHASSDTETDSDAGEFGRTETFRLDGGQFKLDLDAGVVQLGSVSGFVFVDEDGDGVVPESAAPIARVTVELLDSDGKVVATTETDSNGRYVFGGLPPGSYVVRETDSPDWTSSGDADGVNDNEIAITGRDFYDTMTCSLGDYVWEDANGDGIQGRSLFEPGVADVLVTLLDESGETVATTTTGSDGRYLFADLRPGTYVVAFTPPAGFGFTKKEAGRWRKVDSNADESGRTDPVSISFARTDKSIDAGLVRLQPAIEVVKTAGGAKDGETLVLRDGADVTYTYVVRNVGGVELRDIVVTDDKLGEIGRADRLAVGQSVTFTKTAKITGDTTNIATVTAQGGVRPVETVSGTDSAVVTVVPYGYLGDRVWKDSNGNGLQDADEPGVAGVTVTLRQDGAADRTTTTDENGFYGFSRLDAGTYTVQVAIPEGYRVTTRDEGADDTIDSDVDSTGLTGAIDLATGETDRTWDAGLVPLASGVEVVKTAGGAADGAILERTGATEVVYSYVVRNIGETTLSGLVVSDDKLGEIGKVELLAPGASMTFTKSAVISNDTVNIATITGTPSASDGTPIEGFEPVTGTDDAVVVVIPDDPTPDPTICDLVDLGKRYNAVIFGDLTAKGGDSEGALLVWGDADLATGYSVGLAVVGDPTPKAPAHEDVLVVGGDLVLGQQQLNGNAVHGGQYNGADRSWQDYEVRHVTPVTIGPDGNVPEDLSGRTAAEIKADFLAASDRIAAWPANGSYTTTNENAIILKGTDPHRNVFEIPANLWNNAGWDRVIDVPAGSKVIIRVPGTWIGIDRGAIRLPEGVGNEDVLYHYPDAMNIETKSFDHNGSVLAPKANAKLQGGAIEGLAVFGGNVETSVGFEFHNYGLDVFFCPVYPEIDLVATVEGFRDGAIARVESGSRVVVRQTLVNVGSSWLEEIVLTAADGRKVAVRDLAPGETTEVVTVFESVTNDFTCTASVVAVPKDGEGKLIAGFLEVADEDIACVAMRVAAGGEGEGGSGSGSGSGRVPRADIAVTEMWFNHAPTIVDEDFSISIRVKNAGDVAFTDGDLAIYLVDNTHAATVMVEQASNFDVKLPLGVFIPKEEKVFVVKGLKAAKFGGTFRVIAYADFENKTIEYSEGDNQNNLTYELTDVTVDIDVVADGVKLSWNNNWGQVYSIIGSNDLTEWFDVVTGIPSARDGVEKVVVNPDGTETIKVITSETNVYKVPFPTEYRFFRLRVDQR